MLVACGGDSSPDEPGAADAPQGSAPADEPAATSQEPEDEPAGEPAADAGAVCSLATADMVAAAFGGSAANGVEGVRSCSFEITGGSASSVSVFLYGAASDWDEIRRVYEDNRGGTTDVTGVGDEAFNPNDVGEYDLVVLSGDVAFGVGVVTGPDSPDIPGDMVELAQAIASSRQ